jgi:hypothetical protein
MLGCFCRLISSHHFPLPSSPAEGFLESDSMRPVRLSESCIRLVAGQRAADRAPGKTDSMSLVGDFEVVEVSLRVVCEIVAAQCSDAVEGLYLAPCTVPPDS